MASPGHGPRSPSLDAAVEEMRQLAIRVGAAVARHLPAAPTGEPQEPSDKALIAATVALAKAQGLAEGVIHHDEFRGPVISRQAHAALRAAYAVDHPREPSPELRPDEAKAVLHYLRRLGGVVTATSTVAAAYRNGVDKLEALAALREEQGR